MQTVQGFLVLWVDYLQYILRYGVIQFELFLNTFFRWQPFKPQSSLNGWNICISLEFFKGYQTAAWRYLHSVSLVCRTCQQHSHNAIFHWNFQLNSFKIMYAIIDWVWLGFTKQCIVGHWLICLIGLRYDDLGGQTDQNNYCLENKRRRFWLYIP